MKVLVVYVMEPCENTMKEGREGAARNVCKREQTLGDMEDQPSKSQGEAQK